MVFEVEAQEFRLCRLEATRALTRGPPPSHVGEGGAGGEASWMAHERNQRPHPDTGPQPPPENLEMPHEKGDN